MYIIILKLLNSVSVIITNRETVRMNVKVLQSGGFYEEGGLCSHGLFFVSRYELFDLYLFLFQCVLHVCCVTVTDH